MSFEDQKVGTSVLALHHLDDTIVNVRLKPHVVEDTFDERVANFPVASSRYEDGSGFDMG